MVVKNGWFAMVKTQKSFEKTTPNSSCVWFFPNFSLVRLPPAESLRSLDLYISCLILSPWRCSKRRILRFSISVRKKPGGCWSSTTLPKTPKRSLKNVFSTPLPKKNKFYNGDSVKKFKNKHPILYRESSVFSRCVCFFALIVFRRRKADACSLLSGLTKNQSAENPLVPDAQSHRPSLPLY